MPKVTDLMSEQINYDFHCVLVLVHWYGTHLQAQLMTGCETWPYTFVIIAFLKGTSLISGKFRQTIGEVGSFQLQVK